MKKSQPTPAKKKLKARVKPAPSSSPTVISMLRKRVASAEAHLKQAREHKRQAKQRRKLAKLLAKRARKAAKQAKIELAAVRAALARAVEAAPKLAKRGTVRRKSHSAKPTARAAAPAAKKPSRPRRDRVRRLPTAPVVPADLPDEMPPLQVAPIVESTPPVTTAGDAPLAT